MVTKSDIQALLEDGPEQAAQLAERLETDASAAAARRPCPATRRCGVRGGMERHRTAAWRRWRCRTGLHTFGHPLLHRQTRIAVVPAVGPTEPTEPAGSHRAAEKQRRERRAAVRQPGRVAARERAGSDRKHERRIVSGSCCPIRCSPMRRFATPVEPLVFARPRSSVSPCDPVCCVDHPA